MAPRSYNPYRKCDFCNANNYPSYHTRYERRAWTLHHHSNKMTCPNCRKKGEEAERLAILEVRCRLRADAQWLSVVGGRTDEQMVVGCRASDRAVVGGRTDEQMVVGCRASDRAVVGGRTDEQMVVGCLASDAAHDAGSAQPDNGQLTTDNARLAPSAQPDNGQLTTDNARLAPSAQPDNRQLTTDNRATDNRQPTTGNRAAEPPGKYETSGDRFQRIEKGKVIARLEDIAGVLRRHNALKDAPGLAKYLEDIRERVANDNLMEGIERIRTELALRAVWISHQGRIICRVDGCWWKFNAGSVLELIGEAKRIYSGRQQCEGAPKLGAARLVLDDDGERLLANAEHNARVARKSASPALRRYFEGMLLKVYERLGVERKAA